MLQEVARKRPAQVVGRQPVQTRALPQAGVMVIGPLPRGQLAAEVTRMWHAGQIERDYQTARRGAGWIAQVALRPRRTWLQRNGLRTAVLAAGLVLLGWGMVVLLRAAATLLAVLLPYALALGVVAALIALAGGGTKIVQKVTINK